MYERILTGQSSPPDVRLSVAIASIKTNNYRQEAEFDSHSLEELAKDIARNGLLQPVLLRETLTSGYSYELISGERRMRASAMAGLTHLDAIIKKVDEKGAKLLRLSENLHRKDVHPLSEARVYLDLALMGYSTKGVARLVSKSESFVISRLILNELTDHWRDLFWLDGIAEKTAMVVARLSKENQHRIERLFPRKNIEENGVIVRKFSFNSVNDVIKSKLFLNLNAADFPKDDENLCPKAGCCLSCPKRTGYNKLLFSEISDGDFCMDADCFEQKSLAHYKNQKSKLLSKGKPVLELSTVYSEDSRMLHRSEVEVLSPQANLPADAKEVIIANGESLGKIIHVRIKQTGEGSLEKTAHLAAQRKEKLLQEKTEKQLSELLASSITGLLSESLQQRDAATYGKILDYLIIERIGNGHSKAFLDHLSARFNWPPIDRSHVESRAAMIENCVRSTPVKRKIELFIDLFVYAKALDEDKSKLLKMASSIGLDIDLLRRQTGLGEAHNDDPKTIHAA